MGLFDRGRVKVHVLIRGRIGETWQDVDKHVRVPANTTLAQFVDAAERAGVPLRDALANSPHLHDTMMLNGERCPLADNADRIMVDGDELYLLAPLAGG